MAQTFFYDNQVRRFLLQFIRAFSNFQVEYGKNREGINTLITVPVKYGDATRMAATIIRDNSENKVIPTPMISCYITEFNYARDRVQEPNFIDKKHIRMRKYNKDTGEYENQQGNAFTIERLMPVPYNLTMNVDIWTSNTQQKLQLMEQILVLYNPALEIQSTDNYLDWTSLSAIELTNVNWSSRSIPQGADDQIDIGTLTFNVPIWLTSPSKVKKLGVITKIVASIFDESGSINDGVIDNNLLLGDRMNFTPMNYGILLIGNTVQIIDNNETVTNKVAPNLANDPPSKVGTDDVSWRALINQYGELQGGVSQVRLTVGNAEVIGTIAYHPSDDYKLLFTIQSDTIPTNDLPPVLSVINPFNKRPGSGLSNVTTGQRYLILKDIGNSVNVDGPDAWKGTDNSDLIANANDIIQYDGIKWNVQFDSSAEKGTHYVINTNTGIQYKWTGSSWVKSYEGEYRAGQWSIVI
jgi:hypothetical protein